MTSVERGGSRAPAPTSPLRTNLNLSRTVLRPGVGGAVCQEALGTQVFAVRCRGHRSSAETVKAAVRVHPRESRAAETLKVWKWGGERTGGQLFVERLSEAWPRGTFVLGYLVASPLILSKAREFDLYFTSWRAGPGPLGREWQSLGQVTENETHRQGHRGREVHPGTEPGAGRPEGVRAGWGTGITEFFLKRSVNVPLLLTTERKRARPISGQD